MNGNELNTGLEHNSMHLSLTRDMTCVTRDSTLVKAHD